MEKQNESSAAVGVQTVSSIVTALAAVFAVVTQSNPTMSWALVVIALAAVASASYKPAAANMKARLDRIRRDRSARKYWPQVFQFELRFRDFVNRDRCDTLRYALTCLCNKNQNEMKKLCPPDFLHWLFPLLEERHNLYPARNEKDFSLAVREFQQFVWLYNYEYLIHPLEHLTSPEWKGKIPDEHRHEINSSRERWAHFVDDFELFLKQLNAEFGKDMFMRYLERAKDV